MRALYMLLFTVLIWNVSLGQASNFEFTYGELSLFPSPFHHNAEEVFVKIKTDSLWYTHKQRTTKYREIEKYGQHDEMSDTIWRYDTLTQYKKISYRAVDSIIMAIKDIDTSNYLNDTEVFVTSSIMIMDGGETIIDLKYNKKKLKITLANTFDSTAFQIVNIINPYLPVQDKITIPYSQWNDDIEQQKHLDSLYRKSH